MRGRGLWECTSCVVLGLSGLLGQDGLASASHVGRNPLQQIQQLKQQRRDADFVHRIAKAQITPPPVAGGDVLRRQEGATCASDHQLCPPELNGGCCEKPYECAFDSCYATTAAPATGCGRSGYYACPGAAIAGCCPVGYICGETRCLPPAGASTQEAKCPASFTLCPASASYGCCKEGYACAVNGCYKTEPYGTTVVRTFTSTSSGLVLRTTATITSTATPSAPAIVPLSEDVNTVVKFYPTSIPKVEAIKPTEAAGGGGLSPGAIGGIVAGIVVVLIAVVVAAFFIIRRVNQVVEIVESKKGSDMPKSHSKTASQVHQMEVDGGQLHYNPPYEDDIGIDSLIQSNTSAAGTPAPFHDPNTNNRGRSESNPAGGFTPSPNMFPAYDEPNRSRHASPDSNAGWFEHPALHNNLPPGPGAQNTQPMRAAPIRQSSGSQGDAYGNYQYTHYRNQSNTSELSADGGSDRGGASPQIIPELAASGGFAAELPGQPGVRSRSSSNTSARGQYRNHHMHHSMQRSDSNMSDGQQGAPQGGAQGLGLSPLDEEGTEMHGYYGRRDQQSGQTAAGLEEVEWDMSSPVDPGYVPRPYPKDQPGGA
ncbi:hypothetical protein QBC40DRAFT_195862 [Triangularia verruculosa]|uniref:Uncharacterized protein n=1 Tax=Triangularia verruculosa TaxID=2587418 RepID=A0AAN6XRN7_9PEZI|nr:hypothetical protein QBC40DRAFT_195862 [Triangularia verruculosa]